MPSNTVRAQAYIHICARCDGIVTKPLVFVFHVFGWGLHVKAMGRHGYGVLNMVIGPLDNKGFLVPLDTISVRREESIVHVAHDLLRPRNTRTKSLILRGTYRMGARGRFLETHGISLKVEYFSELHPLYLSKSSRFRRRDGPGRFLKPS